METFVGYYVPAGQKLFNVTNISEMRKHNRENKIKILPVEPELFFVGYLLPKFTDQLMTTINEIWHEMKIFAQTHNLDESECSLCYLYDDFEVL